MSYAFECRKVMCLSLKCHMAKKRAIENVGLESRVGETSSLFERGIERQRRERAERNLPDPLAAGKKQAVEGSE